MRYMLSIGFEIPHTYREGSDLEVHLHWAPSSTNTGRVENA
jgi:hypothetical protein